MDDKEKVMANITFSVLLSQILTASGIRFAKAGYELVRDAGVNVSYSTFANYKAFTTVPSFNMARQILDCFDYQCSDEELRSILDYSNRELHYLRTGEKRILQRGISLNPEYFEESLSPDALQAMLEDAAQTQLGPDGTVNQYINELIRNDLISKGFITDSDHEA